jgi:sRNA-binding regulator protein Hfq
MNPDVGKYVQIFLRNGFKIEGLVKIWSDHKSVIEQTNETIIIQKTLDDVFIVKIFENKNITENKSCLIEEQPDIGPAQDIMPKNPIKEQYGTAELRTVEYGTPNIFKKSSAFKHPAKKIARKIGDNYSALQKLFNKEIDNK